MAKKIEKLIYTNERGESITFSHASIFHTNEVSGLSDVRNEIYSINSMGQDGDTYLGNRIQSREIEIVGSIRERDKDRMRDYRRQMNRVLNPQYSATLTYECGDFRRVIDCKIDNAPAFTRKAIFQDFTIQLLCLNPFWRKEAKTRDDSRKEMSMTTPTTKKQAKKVISPRSLRSGRCSCENKRFIGHLTSSNVR